MTCSIETINYIDDSYEYMGFVITTTNGGTIRVKVSNSPQCCETWGIKMSRGYLFREPMNTYESLIGKNIVDIKYWEPTNIEMQNEDEAGDSNAICLESGGGMIYVSISLENEEIPVILTAWTAHNGYYPHDCIINWDLNIDGKNEVMAKIEYL